MKGLHEKPETEK